MKPANDFSTIVDSQRDAKAILLLLYAYQEQQRRQQNRWEEVLVTEDALLDSGFTTEAIRTSAAQGYLVCKQVLSVEEEATVVVPALTLTESGAAFAVAAWGLNRPTDDSPAQQIRGTTSRRRQQKPYWDGQSRNLYYGETPILHFRRSAPNQMGILDAFQELRWPARLDDPLPPRGGVDRRERLYETIRSLNGGQVPWRIRFQMESDGQGVRQSVIEV